MNQIDVQETSGRKIPKFCINFRRVCHARCLLRRVVHVTLRIELSNLVANVGGAKSDHFGSGDGMVRDLIGTVVALTLMASTTAGFLALAAQGDQEFQSAHRLRAAAVLLMSDVHGSRCPGASVEELNARVEGHSPFLRPATFSSHHAVWPAVQRNPRLPAAPEQNGLRLIRAIHPTKSPSVT
jgi:hypothetical protein